MPETGMHFWDGVIIGAMLATVAWTFVTTWLLDRLDAARRDKALSATWRPKW